MSGNNFVTKHLLRRRVSEHRPYEEDNDNNDNSSSSSSSSSSDEDEGRNKGSKGRKDGRGKDKKDKKDRKDKKDKAEWVQVQDPVGRLCWQNRKTGQVTYGNNIAVPQQGYNPNLTGDPVYGAAPASAVPIGPPGYMVQPGPYIPSPVGGGYGRSPVAMYQAPPWAGGGAGPAVPVVVPDYVKKQIHAEKKRKEEESRKKLEKTGTWQRHYSSEGTKYWQNTASGRKLPMDPYK